MDKFYPLPWRECRSMMQRNNGYFARVARNHLPRTDRVFCIAMHDLHSPIAY